MANIFLNKIIDEKTKQLVLDALFNKNEMQAFKSAKLLKNEKYLKLIAVKSIHKSCKWIAIESIDDKKFFCTFNPGDKDLQNACNMKYSYL